MIKNNLSANNCFYIIAIALAIIVTSFIQVEAEGPGPALNNAGNMTAFNYGSSGSSGSPYGNILKSIKKDKPQAQDSGALPPPAPAKSESTGKTITPSPDMQKKMKQSLKVTNEVESQLAGLKNDPCYDIKFQKAVGKKITGSDLPWVTCTPVNISVTWNVNIQQGIDPARKNHINYVLEETYPGYLGITYNQHKRDRIWLLHMGTSSRLRPEQATAKLSSANASLWLYYICGILCADPAGVQGTVTASNIADFEIDKCEGCFEFKYETDHKTNKDATIHDLKITSPTVTGKFRSGKDEFFEEFTENDVSLSGSSSFTLSEIMHGVNEGKIIKEFPVESEIKGIGPCPVCPVRKGTATVKILFNQKPGVLAVTPADGFHSSGPDKNGKYSPDAKTYTLKNTGKSEISYSVSKSKPWISLSGTSGVLNPGASRKVKVSINEQAGNLKGPDEDSVRFTNTTNNKGSTSRPVKLSKEEHWRAVYSGYNIFFISISYIKSSQAAYGIKAYWNTVIDFIIEDGKYKSGKGYNSIVKVDNYSQPAGISECVTLKNSIKFHPRAFNVPGSASKTAATLTLPTENDYLIGYSCFLDTDALKDILRSKGYTKFPTIEGMDKSKIVKTNLGILPNKKRTVSLSDYERVMEHDKFQGYKVKVRRIK